MGYRVGIDGHVLDGKNQGTKTFLRGLLRAIPSTAHEFVVYCFHPERQANEITNPRVRFQPLHNHNAALRLGFEFPRSFRRDRIDIGMFQYVAPPIGPTRTMVVVHDLLPFTHPQFFPLPFRLRMAALLPHSVARAAAVVTVSEATRAAIRARFPRAAAVHLVPEGPSFAAAALLAPRTEDLDADALPHGLRAGRFVLAVGRIEPRKNIDLLTRAFLRAGRDDIDLVLVGAQDMGYEWRPPTHPRVRHIVGADDALLLRLHRAAGLFVYPSAAEGFGLPLLDAVLAGAPVLSSDRTSMPEVGGTSAHYFDPDADDAEAWLANAIAHHFGGDPFQPATAEMRARHARHYAWDAAAQRLIEILDGM